jgi:hypothetical protein
MEKIIYFSDNPDLSLKTVKTAMGQTEYRVNCKKIKGEYYTLNKDCFEIKGVWYRVNSGLIEFDHELKHWFLVKDMPHNMILGVVGHNGKDFIRGRFTPNPYNNCKVVVNSDNFRNVEMAINTDILTDAGYVEDLSTSAWYSPNYRSMSDLKSIRNVLDHTGKGYNIEDNGAELIQKTALYNDYKIPISKEATAYGKFLGDTTWGVEIECAKGHLPDYIQSRYGVIICRDGSLNDDNGKPGPEFVTIPLKGAKGLVATSKICNELSKRTTVDLKCSLHIHLGNIPKTKIFLISVYRLARKLQKEIFQIFPYYKANPEGIKQKNYNQKLPAHNIYNADASMTKTEFNEYINEAFKTLFSWLSEGFVPDQAWNRKVHKHPIAQKWNRTKRYYWLNLMNTIFSERNTAEFRLHTPTTNSQKVINWLFICNAIVKYADTHCNRILTSKGGISLKEVLSYYSDNFGKKGEFLSEYLLAYIEERKAKFFRDYQKGDFISAWEMKEDRDYTFTYKGVTDLF